MSASQVRIVTIRDKPGSRCCGIRKLLPIQHGTGAKFLKEECKMKIKKAGCLGVALLVSASVASPVIANPDHFIPIRPDPRMIL